MSIITVFEVIMTVVGAITLLRRSFFMPPRTAITGWRATAIGLFLLLPLPLTLLAGAALAALINRSVLGFDIIPVANTLETGLVVGGLLGALVVATLPPTREEIDARQDDAPNR